MRNVGLRIREYIFVTVPLFAGRYAVPSRFTSLTGGLMGSTMLQIGGRHCGWRSVVKRMLEPLARLLVSAVSGRAWVFSVVADPAYITADIYCPCSSPRYCNSAGIRTTGLRTLVQFVWFALSPARQQTDISSRANLKSPMDPSP